MRRTALALCLAALATVAGAQQSPTQWKWRDASGQLHVSDMPPPASVPGSAILERPTDLKRPGRNVPQPSTPAASAAAPAAKPAGSGDAELDARRKKSDEEKTAQQKAQAQKVALERTENCTRAKAQFNALNDGLRIVRTNEKGEREVLDDKARAEEMQRMRSVMATDCK
jgi:hypothetical protein